MRHDAHGYWIAEVGGDAGFPERQPSLDGDVRADILVLGGGYTGMWAAWHARRLAPEARIVLLEAERCGHGPSGRNGGFVNSMWFSLPTLRLRFGDQGALAVARAAADSVAEVGHFCEEESVDAWYRRGGYLQVSAAPAQDSVRGGAVAAANELGVADVVEVLDEAATRARCDSPVFRSAAFYADAATVHPARLAAGLRAAIIEAGVEVHEHSPGRRVRPGSGETVVETEHGRLSAPAAVLATGAALLGVRPLRHALTATSSHMVITEPVPDLLEEIGWSGGECITDSRAMIHYFRTTPDGRIAFGWGGGSIVAGARLGGKTDVDPSLARQVEAHMRRFFPGLEGRAVTYAWGGPIDVSPTHLPVIRSLGPRGGGRAFAGYGYTGNGVGPSQMIGRSLASLALGRSDEPSRLALIDPPPARVPPEPFRYAGGTAIRRAVLRKERLEEEGRSVDPLTRAVCGIPERIGIHIGR